MAAIGERLTALDSTFLELEQAAEGPMMHIGGALIFDPEPGTGGAPSLAALTALLEQRLGALPRFRCRLSEPRVHGLQRPDWIEDRSFDIGAHVRHEIIASRQSTLNVEIGTTRRFASVPFDLAEVKEIKAALGGTINDVVLAVAAGALRKLLEHRYEDLDEPLLRDGSRQAQPSCSSPAPLRRCCTRRSPRRCSLPGCSTSRSRMFPGRRSRSTGSGAGCAASSRWCHCSPTTPWGSRSSPMTASWCSGSTPTAPPRRTWSCSKPGSAPNSPRCCRSPEADSVAEESQPPT